MTSVKEDLPSAVAATLSGDLGGTDADDANTVFSEFMSAVTRDCIARGAVMVGHVKANIRSGGEMMSISSTTDDGNVRSRSLFSSPVRGYDMTLNVIVYGLDETAISEIITERGDMIGRPGITVMSETECKDPECTDPSCGDPAHRIIMPM